VAVCGFSGVWGGGAVFFVDEYCGVIDWHVFVTSFRRKLRNLPSSHWMQIVVRCKNFLQGLLTFMQ
jgi:hypothetical protein